MKRHESSSIPDSCLKTIVLLFKEIRTNDDLNKVNYLQLQSCCLKSMTIRP